MTPLEGGPVSVFDGDANFGFNFTCEMDNGQKRAVIRGKITYHDSPAPVTVVGAESTFPEIRIHGTVESLLHRRSVPPCEEAAEMLRGPPAALFEGTYRPQDRRSGALGQRRDRRSWWVRPG